MKSTVTIFIVVLFFASPSFSQQPYDNSKVTDELEINFASSSKRGIRYGNWVYYVDSIRHSVIAYENEQVRWQANVTEGCSHLAWAHKMIRHIKLIKNTLYVVFDKHAYAHIDLKTGGLYCDGSD